MGIIGTDGPDARRPQAAGAQAADAGGADRDRLQGYRQGQVLFAVQARIEACQTRTPQPYTEDALIDDMMNAGKFARTEAERAILRTVAGIGTSRTRGAIVSGLLAKGYLEGAKKGKLHQLRLTPHGRDFIDRLPDAVKSVSMTALWEKALGQIACAEVAPQQLRLAMRAQVTKLIAEAMQSPVSAAPAAPLSGSGLGSGSGSGFAARAPDLRARSGASPPAPSAASSKPPVGGIVVPKRPSSLFGPRAARAP